MLHPGASLPGLVRFLFPPSATNAAVMSVVQTSAFAAYPFGSFEVRNADGSPGRLAFDALVPLPNQSPPEPEVRVRVFADRVVVAFADGWTVTTAVDGLARSLDAARTVLLAFEPAATFDTMMRVAGAVSGDRRVIVLGIAVR